MSEFQFIQFEGPNDVAKSDKIRHVRAHVTKKFHRQKRVERILQLRQASRERRGPLRLGKPTASADGTDAENTTHQPPSSFGKDTNRKNIQAPDSVICQEERFMEPTFVDGGEWYHCASSERDWPWDTFAAISSPRVDAGLLPQTVFTHTFINQREFLLLYGPIIFEQLPDSSQM